MGDTRRRAITNDTARCTEAHLGCPCDGDDAVHAARADHVTTAQADSAELVDCPECGEPSSPLRIVAWGHCRACRTADSRAKSPLRW
jgi:predicted nucleic acid-binding Zn ribbon protein